MDMDIQVYKWNNTNFEFNGDRTLNPYSCILKVQLNGICEIELEHPYDNEKSWTYLESEDIVSVVTPWSDRQLFRIYDREKTITGLKVYARHIYFDLVKYNIESNLHIKGKNGKQALKLILKNTPFIAHSNIVDINSCYFFKNNVIEGIAGNKDNCFLNRWGGELFLDNYNVYINSRIGTNHGLRISYGYNLENLSLKRNTEEVFTRLYPYVVKNTTDTIELPEKYVDSKYINNYPNIYEKYINLSEFMHLKEGDDDSENAYETLEDLYVAMRKKCKELFEKGLDTPKTTGTVNMVILENTTEYKNVKELAHVNLGDDILVEHYDIGIESKTRCVGYIWDCINKKYLNIELGELEKDFFDFQNTTTHNLDNILNSDGTINPGKLQGIINSLTVHFRGMRDVAQKQHILAMLFEDRIKGSATYGALAVGTKGLIIANERLPDDSDWDWNTFIGGGFAMADWLIGNLMTVLITNKDKSFEIDLKKPGGALFRNNGKDAIKIENNMIKLYNWKKNGDYIGALMSLVQGDDENKPLIGLANDMDSALALGYAEKDSTSVPSYIELDKYNVLEDSGGKPVRIYEEVDFKGNKVYNIDIRSDNGENNLHVGDHYVNITTKNNEIVVSNDGIRMGKDKSVYYDARTGEFRCNDIVLNGVIKNTSGNTVFDPNAPIGGGADGDWQNGIMSSNQLRMLKGYEGLGRYEYRDSGGVLTIGYGITKSEPDIYNKLLANQPVPEEMAAKEMFNVNNNRYGKPIVSKVKALGCTTQQQFDALVDLAFNAGTGVIGANNSLMNAIRRNPTDESYIRPIWENFYIRDNAGNKLEGLRLRRIAEANIYFQGRYEKRQIPILGRNGNPTGSVVTENNGDGWLPPRIDSTGNFKTVNNAYGNGWIIPVTGGQVTALFGHYPSGAPHSGTDFGVPIGTPVRASKSGTVIKRRELTTSYGKYLFVDHGGGLVTIYAHNSQLLVSEGQHVTVGQIIAKSGNTGNSSGPHSHIELRYNGTPVNFAPSLRIGDHV